MTGDAVTPDFEVGDVAVSIATATTATSASQSESEHSNSEKVKIDHSMQHTNQLLKSKSTRKRSFNQHWKNEFPWLIIEDCDNGELLFCTLCRLANMKNSFASTGAS